MNNDYIKDEKIIDKTEKQKEKELIISILKAKKDLEEANKNYEYAEDELIDYYIYQIKATIEKINYLMRKAKSKGISLNVIDQLEIKIEKAI